MPDSGPRRVAVFTAIPVEYQAVRAHLTNLRQELHSIGTVYERGDFTANSQVWDVLIAETGIGNAAAATETVLAIEHFKPDFALFVGVAGGLKDVKLGDVVAATKVYGYESGKSDPIFRPRPDVYNSTHRMKQRARAEAKKPDWLKRLKEVFHDPDLSPHVHVAPIASGNQVAASTESDVLTILRSSYSDAVAIEMEGYGFLRAVHAYPYIDALVVRGISDLVDNKREADAEKFQEIAARRASTFAFEVLAKLKGQVHQPDGQRSETSTSHEGQQVSETPQHATITRKDPRTPSSEVLMEGLLNEFRTRLPSYVDRLKRIRDLFDVGRNISSDQYKSTIRSLDPIDKHVQMLCEHASELSFYDSARLFAIRDQIDMLKSELQKIRLPPWFIKTSGQRRGEEINRESIRAKCKALSTILERF